MPLLSKRHSFPKVLAVCPQKISVTILQISAFRSCLQKFTCFRNIIVDNSRVDKGPQKRGEREGPEKLIDINNGIFKVPEKAGGKY